MSEEEGLAHANRLASEMNRVVVIYYHAKSDPVNLNYKALSKLSVLRDDFTFVSVSDPS